MCYLGDCGDCGVNCHHPRPSAPVLVLKSEEVTQHTFGCHRNWDKDLNVSGRWGKRHLKDSVEGRDTGQEGWKQQRKCEAFDKWWLPSLTGLLLGGEQDTEGSEGDSNTGLGELQGFQTTPISEEMTPPRRAQCIQLIPLSGQFSQAAYGNPCVGGLWGLQL